MSTTITHDELLRTGLSAPDIATLVAIGTIHRLRRGVYTHELHDDELLQHHALITATRRVVDPSAVISHTSAGVVHGLPVRRDSLDRVTMTRTTAGHADRSSHLIMRNTRITEPEIDRGQWGRITTLPRTVADLARTEQPEWGVVATDAALRLGVPREEIRAALALHPRLHGLRRARAVVRFGDSGGESPGESISRWNMSMAGLPAPVLQQEFFDDQGEFIARADFFWPDHGLIGEFDGRTKYVDLLRPGQTIEDVMFAEKRREGGLQAQGLRVVRWDWAVAISPSRLAGRIGPLLRAT